MRGPTRFGDTIPIVTAEVHAARTVDDVASAVRTSYPISLINVRSAGKTHGCETHGRWDYERLTQAITSLVSNAVHHRTDGAPIEIEAYGSTEELVISVRDQGPAIATDQIDRIFDGMKALGAPSGEATGDTWVSASTLSTISFACIASITVQTSTEHGTMFRVHLPRGVSEAPPRRSPSWRRARDRHTRSHNQGPC